MSPWFEPSRPVQVEGGLKARSRRGSIGAQWWSRRFIDVLEEICDPGRLSRGRAYARKGQVLSLEVAPGEVRARVQGSRPRPYNVSLQIDAYDAGEWEDLTGELAARAVHRAKLLAGEMPPEIEQVFDDLELPLFPDGSELEMDCSCPDWGWPCKHVSAALYLLAEAFDDDPFLVLAWRGRTREDLLDDLRGAPADEEPRRPGLLDVQDTPFAERMEDFFTGGRVPRVIPGPAPADLLLRALEPPRVEVRGTPLLELLDPVYRSLAVQDGEHPPPGT
ncbi:SWIM zinc finger family protein [Spirillospora sp. CA-128828]|uniref:SWIM zinc finger family protein n=1 Tax=Spirillospora sp. CA-128828 TaxID=3240033 RepID=UPI003D90F0C9